MPQQCRKKSFTEYWVHCQPVVMSYVMSMTRDFHDAEDITQQVAITAAEKFQTYDPQRPFVKWVLAIAHLKTLQALRQRRRDRHIFDDQLHERLVQAYEEVAPEIPRYRGALVHCLEQLTERAQRLLSMRYLQGLEIRRIGDRLGVSNDAVSAKLRRIRATLRACIQRKLNEEAQSDA